MTFMEFLTLLVVAGACGALGQSLVGRSRGGCLLSIVLGFLGAWLGRVIADALDAPALLVVEIDGRDFPIVWSVVGAALFVAAVSFVSRRKV